jgi:hypothetical protein
MIDDRDVWAAGLLIVKRYGDDAILEAATRPALTGGAFACPQEKTVAGANQ